MHTERVQIDRSRQFKRWIDEIADTAKDGDETALKTARYVYDELEYLRELTGEPDEDTATLK